MEFLATDIYEVLKQKQCKGLFHANTVGTSKTFLEKGYIFSRKKIEDLQLYQTVQKSDNIDKEFDVFNDLFFDAINLSVYYNTPNSYGPVLFAYHLELLTSEIVSTVRITKINPLHWKKEFSESDKYYTSIAEFNSKYKTGNKARDGGNHIIISNMDGQLPLINQFFWGVQIDNPDFGYLNGTLIDYIKNYFTLDLINLGYNPDEKIIIRNSNFLKFQYKILSATQKKEFVKRFGPKPKSNR